MNTRKELSEAMFESALPCNPIPFANAIAEGCKEKGSDYIKTDEAKRLLWILNVLAYGELSTIDLPKEYEVLEREFILKS